MNKSVPNKSEAVATEKKPGPDKHKPDSHKKDSVPENFSLAFFLLKSCFSCLLNRQFMRYLQPAHRLTVSEGNKVVVRFSCIIHLF